MVSSCKFQIIIVTPVPGKRGDNIGLLVLAKSYSSPTAMGRVGETEQETLYQLLVIIAAVYKLLFCLELLISTCHYSNCCAYYQMTPEISLVILHSFQVIQVRYSRKHEC